MDTWNEVSTALKIFRSKSESFLLENRKKFNFFFKVNALETENAFLTETPKFLRSKSEFFCLKYEKITSFFILLQKFFSQNVLEYKKS